MVPTLSSITVIFTSSLLGHMILQIQHFTKIEYLNWCFLTILQNMQRNVRFWAQMLFHTYQRETTFFFFCQNIQTVVDSAAMLWFCNVTKQAHTGGKQFSDLCQNGKDSSTNILVFPAAVSADYAERKLWKLSRS